jgi:hypothetical protein
MELANDTLGREHIDMTILLGREFSPGSAYAFNPVPPVPTITNLSRTTWSSCRAVGSLLDARPDKVGRIIAITSNYHGARLRWLLSPYLPRHTELAILESPDITGFHALSNTTARQLVRGEIISWLYCGPLGLLLRPWLVMGLATLGGALYILFIGVTSSLSPEFLRRCSPIKRTEKRQPTTEHQ